MSYLTATFDNVCHDHLAIPMAPGYEVSIITGVVRNATTKHILKEFPAKSSTRYYLCCGVGRIHRLLLSALLGRVFEPWEHVHHINGDTFDNAPINLRLGSPKENSLDKILHNVNGRILRNSHVREIRRMAGFRTRHQLAAQFGISAGHVGSIIRRTRWANLP